MTLKTAGFLKQSIEKFFTAVCRYQDKNTSALIMLKASTRWLAIRGDLLSNILVTAVSAGALFTTQSPGVYYC